MTTSQCGEIFITPPKCIHNEGSQNFYSGCSVVACPGDAVFRCERETTLFGLSRGHKNQWLGCIYTVPEQLNPDIRVCAVHLQRTVS